MAVEQFQGIIRTPPTEMREVCFDEERYVAPSWESMGQLCFGLAQDIIEAGGTYDRLLTLAKGGWTWSRTLADYLAISNVGSIKVEFYQGIDQTAKTPVIVQSLPVNINGENILLFDDVDDTGKSLLTAKSYFKMCGAKEITVATLFHKPHSQITPDFSGATTKAWIIFPHEIRETIDLLETRWTSQGIPDQERIKRYQKIGLNPKMVDYFLLLRNQIKS